MKWKGLKKSWRSKELLSSKRIGENGEIPCSIFFDLRVITDLSPSKRGEEVFDAPFDKQTRSLLWIGTGLAVRCPSASRPPSLPFLLLFVAAPAHNVFLLRFLQCHYDGFDCPGCWTGYPTVLHCSHAVQILQGHRWVTLAPLDNGLGFKVLYV